MEHVVTIKQGVDDIKKFNHKLRNHERNNSDTFAKTVAGPALNWTNESRCIPERITSGVKPNNGGSRHHLSHGQPNRPNNGPGPARQVSYDHQLALNARRENAPTPPSVRELTPPYVPDRPSSAPRPGQTADCQPTLRTGYDNEIARLRTDVVAAVAVAEGARTEEGPWHTVRRPHRKKKINTHIGDFNADQFKGNFFQYF